MESLHDSMEENAKGKRRVKRAHQEDIHQVLTGEGAVKDIPIPIARPQIDVDDIKGKAVYADRDGGGSGVQQIHNGASESWVIQVEKRFDSHQYKIRQPSSDVSIYRVPITIMSSKPDAYVPLVVSLGTYHRHKKDQQLFAMDDHKLEAVQRTLERFNGMPIHHLIAEVGKLEKKIRNCYEDSAIEYAKEALVWMVTMDACFILEFFLTLHTEKLNVEEHISLLFQYNGRQNIYRWEIMRDIMKLENQIPLFVLIHILELGLKNHEKGVRTLGKLLVPFREFRGFPFSLPLSDDEIRSRLEEHINNGACHLLDLSRKVIKDFLTQSSSSSSTSASASASTAREDVSTPSAEKLHTVGIKFEPSNGNVFFEGRYFGSSTFYLPQIVIDDDTEIILRNLMAYEECQGCRWSPDPTIISTYMHLVDDLIDSPEDVGLLKKAKALKSSAGSDEEVAAMINDLCKGITADPGHEYKQVLKEVREHYNSQLKVWISQFREEHCSKPWYVVSLVAAALLLGMTAVQTIFTVKN